MPNTAISSSTSCTGTRRRGKRKATAELKKDDMVPTDDGNCTLQIFANNHIAATVATFLDVPSLAAFGATCHVHHDDIIPTEIQRRKHRYEQIKVEIQALLAPIKPTYDNVRIACQLRTEARALIDAGLGWLRHAYMTDYDIDGNTIPCPVCNLDPWFNTERHELKPHTTEEAAAALVLPGVFYRSPCAGVDQAQSKVTEATIERMRKVVLWIWGVEDHMGGVHEATMFSPGYEDPLHPLRQFNHPEASFFCEVVDGIVSREVVLTNQLDAFRVAARRFIRERPHAFPCLFYAIKTGESLSHTHCEMHAS